MFIGQTATASRRQSEFAVVASNTPHIVFDEIKDKSPIPVLSIVEATSNKAQEVGLKSLGLKVVVILII